VCLRVLVIARSEATKQSILSLRGDMDCFAFARNDDLYSPRHHPRFVPYLAKNICVALSTTCAMRSGEGGGAA
jgi:hypothetical protein